MELSINNAEIFAAISAPNSPCTKSDWYDILHPMIALQNVRDKQAHSLRRRVWDRGFSAKGEMSNHSSPSTARRKIVTTKGSYFC